MRYIPRSVGPLVARAARAFPAVIVTGPRRAGKTTLLRHLFPRAQFVLLEDPDIIGRVRADPNAFLDGLTPPVILDEIQNIPELFNYVRARIDRTPRRSGPWLFTGSQEAPLMKGVTESMAGRAALFSLLPFSFAESPRVTLHGGGFPEVIERPAPRGAWFRSYVQTYLERDLRVHGGIRDLSTFRRFMALLAARCSQVLNRTEFAAPLGVSVPTVSAWLGVLEVTGQVVLVPPYFENFGKRIIKSPKVYFTDSGLACHLLGIDTAEMLQRSLFLGAIMEGFVASEIAKRQMCAGRAPELYYFRDHTGLEVDFLVPSGGGLILLEVKATKTPLPRDGESLVRLAGAIKGHTTSSFVIHRSSSRGHTTDALLPGVRAIPVERLSEALPE